MRKIKRFVLNDSFTVLSAEAQKNVLGGDGSGFKTHCVCETGKGAWYSYSSYVGRVASSNCANGYAYCSLL